MKKTQLVRQLEVAEMSLAIEDRMNEARKKFARHELPENPVLYLACFFESMGIEVDLAEVERRADICDEIVDAVFERAASDMLDLIWEQIKRDGGFTDDAGNFIRISLNEEK